MSLIIIIATIWAVYKAVSVSKEREQQKQLERVKVEQARQREAWKAAQAAERERVRQMEVIEREQARQRAEQARIAKEQERQAAQLAKVAEMTEKLQFKVDELDRLIDYLTPQLGELLRRRSSLEAEIKLGAERFGLRCDSKRKELEKVNDKIFRAESRLNKAKFDRAQAARKLAA